MGKRYIRIRVLLAGAFLAFALPAAAQITAHRDGRGVIVYTNGDAPGAPVKPGSGWLPTHRRQTRENLYEPLVRRLAEQHHLDPRFVEAVIRVESGWNPRAISPKGAEGLMQLLPATASRFGVRNALNPLENIRGGVTYLGNLVRRFGGNLREALAAYYAGQGAVERAGGVPSSSAVAAYVRQVLNSYFQAGSLGRTTETDPGTIYMTVDREGRTVFTNQ